MAILIPVTFYCNSVDKSEYRDPKTGVENTYRFCFTDDKFKNTKDKDWTPRNNLCLTIVNGQFPNIEFGKKYKLTLEEVK